MTTATTTQIIPTLPDSAVRYCATQARHWARTGKNRNPLTRFASHVWDVAPDGPLSPEQESAVTALFEAAIDGIPDLEVGNMYPQMRVNICRYLSQPEPDFEAEKAEAAKVLDEFFALLDDEEEAA